MSGQHPPDPDCPACHGTGVTTVSATFLDRVEEYPVPCKCVTESSEEPAVAAVTDSR